MAEQMERQQPNTDTSQQLNRDIFEAAQCGDTNTVKEYLDLGVPVDVTDEDGWSPVHRALAYRQVEVIRLLMDRGCLMNRVGDKKIANSSYSSPHNTTECGSKCSKISLKFTEKQHHDYVFEAARNGNTVTVKEYLDLGVSVDITDEDGWSPVHHALSYRQVEVIRLLMDRGCLMNRVENRKQAMKNDNLHVMAEVGSKYSSTTKKLQYGTVFEAARCGDTDTVKEYLDLGIPIDLTDEDGRTILHCAAGEGQIKVVELLVERGCSIDPVDNNGWTPSICANAHGRMETLQLLKQIKGPCEEQDLMCLVDSESRIHIDFVAICDDFERQSSFPGTLLHRAAAEGNLEIVDTLVRFGGRSMTEVADNIGTPLHLAVAGGHKDVVSLLLSEGCPIDVVDSEGASVLHYAARCGQIDSIKMLVGKKLSVNVVDNKGFTPLHGAATTGQLETVRTLLQFGGRKSIIKVASKGGTPLHQAVAGGHKDIVSLLLSEGCPINVVDSEGASVLHYAAKAGQIDSIKMLAGKELSVNVVDNKGFTPLHEAAASGELETLHTLLNLGGRKSITKVASIGGTPLHLAVARGHKDVVSLLLNEGCPINVVDSEGASVLHYAAKVGQIDSIKMLVGKELSVNVVDNEGFTPLHEAAASGQLETVRTLLELGGRKSITKVASTGGTPLHQAVAGGHKDIVSSLVNEGCPIKVVDGAGRSIFDYAVTYGQIDMIKMLAGKGFSVNIGDNEGWTPLHEAAVIGQLETVRTLLQLGGRESMIKIAGTCGTPLHQAVGKGHKDIVSLLLNEGCPITVVNSEGSGIINMATEHGQIHMIEMLAGKGLDVNRGDNNGWTPLHSAAVKGLLDSVRTLVSLGGRKSMAKVASTEGTPLHQAVVKGHKDIVSFLLNTSCFKFINVVDSKGRSPIYFAALLGHIDMIEMLSRKGLNVNICDNEGATPLHAAANNGHLEAVGTLLRLGGKRSMTKVAGTAGTPLHQAVGAGHKDIVSLLLNEGCPVDVMNSNGVSLIHVAAQKGHIDLIEILVGYGLDVNIGDNDGLTPLHLAAVDGQIEAVRTLLRLGGRKSMKKVAIQGGTPLHQAVARGHRNIVSLLFDEGCPINVVDDKGTSLIHSAASEDRIDMIEMLTGKGLDVNICDNEGLTPLHAAAGNGHLEAVGTLLRLGGKKSMTKVAGIAGTPLHQAVANGHKNMFSLLLNEGCPINVVDGEGRSLVHFAAKCGQIDIIEMLAKLGLDVNIDNNCGWTPLHSAALAGEFKSVRTLLRLGARKSMTKVSGTAGTPLHQAVGKGHKDIVSLLLNEGCPIDVVNTEGMNLIHAASLAGQIDMIELCAEHGSNINMGTRRGETPLHYAVFIGQHKLMHTLLRLGGRKSLTKIAGTVGTPIHYAAAYGRSDMVSLLLNEGSQNGIADLSSLANLCSSEGMTPLMWAAMFGHVTTFKELVKSGGDIHHSDNFGMTFGDYILILNTRQMVEQVCLKCGSSKMLNRYCERVKQFCAACGIECSDEGLLGVVSALNANKLLDTNKILCLAAVVGNVHTLNFMLASQYPLDQQRMSKIPSFLSFTTGGKTSPDQFRISDEPLNPLHISLLSAHGGDYFNVEFIEKLTSHKCTRYTVNELFPNGLSPLDVARQFELHDIAVIIERAGGGPGVWADLPKEMEDKCIDIVTSLKELRGRELNDEATSRIFSCLGYQLVDSDENDGSEAKKILEDKPKRSLVQKYVLSSLKFKGKWERVGDLLEIEEDILDKIGEEATDDDDAYYSMLKHWLKNGHNVTWKTLLDAVGHFETKKTVDDITDKIVEELAPRQVRN